MPHISPNRRRSIAVLGHGPNTSKATQKRRRAYSIAPGEKLSPAARARTLVPRKSILKGSVSARPSQESASADDTVNVTQTMDFTEVVRTAASRKSLARRVSFASHAHVRLFEKQDPNTSGDVSRSESEGDEEDSREDSREEEGEGEDPVELDFLHEDDAPRRPARRRSSTGFNSSLGEQSMSMDMDTDGDDTGPIPQDFLDGPALNDERFSDGGGLDDMDMTEVIPGSIRARPSLGLENLGATPTHTNGSRRRSSTVTSSLGQSENQVPRRPLGVLSQSGGGETPRQRQQQQLYPSLDDVPDPSPSRPIPNRDPDVSIGDTSDMDLTMGSTAEPTISSTGDDTQPMEFTIPVIRPPPPPSDLWLNLRAMTHQGAEQPYVPPEMEASDDPEANAIVSGHGDGSLSRTDGEGVEGSSPSRGENDSMDLTVALSRLAQARPSLGLPLFSASDPDPDDDPTNTTRQEESFVTNDDSLDMSMDLEGDRTVNLTTLRLSLEGRKEMGKGGEGEMEFTGVYGGGGAKETPRQHEQQEKQAEKDTEEQEKEAGKENAQQPPKLPIFTLTKSQSSAPPPPSAPQQPPQQPQPPQQQQKETEETPGPFNFKPSIPLPVFTLQDPAQSAPPSTSTSRPPQPVPPKSPAKKPTTTTTPTPFTFSLPPRSPAKPSSTASKLPQPSPKKLPGPIFKGTAAFAPPSNSPAKRVPLKRPAEGGNGGGQSPKKRLAVGENRPQAKEVPTSENPPKSQSQGRRASGVGVRRPSGYFAQRKSLGGVGAGSNQPPSTAVHGLSKSTSTPASLAGVGVGGSSRAEDVPAPFRFRGATDGDGDDVQSVFGGFGGDSQGQDVQAQAQNADDEDADIQVPDVHPPTSSSPSTSPTVATVAMPSAEQDTGRLSPEPPYEEETLGQDGFGGEEEMDMTDRWRDGLEDGGLVEDDEPTISIEQFFEMTNIRFMDEITAPRRSTIHPGHLGQPNRRRSLTSSHSEETESIPLSEFLVAMAVDVPQLELYSDLSGQLSAWVEESKKICRQAEEDAVKVTPALFREFAEADELEKQDLLHQLKLIKANNIDSAKSQWYEWKSTWVEQLQESAESAFAELENDAKALESIISQAQSSLPSLREEYAQIMAELEKEEADIAEIESSDKNFLSDLKVSIAEQDVEVQALQANVSEAQAKLNRLQERDTEIRQQKEELESAISRGEELIQRQTESTSLRVFRLKDELEALEDLHQWRAVKLDANLKEFLYASRIKVSIPCVAHRPDSTRLHVERTKASRMKERDEFPELSELMLIGAPHVVAASRKEPDLRTIVQRLSDFWASCAQIRLQLTFLAVQYPLELQLLPGDNGLPTFQVSAKVLFPSTKSKANIMFIFDSDTYSRWPLSIGLLKCDVNVAYGRADRQKILDAVQSRLGQATSSENHGCLLDACIEATEQLAFA